MKREEFEQKISAYLPPCCAADISRWFYDRNVILKVTRRRSSKLGDFRSGTNVPLTITINHNLNRYSFLITLLHEMAHAEVHLNYRRRMRPHGEEWKRQYRFLLEPYLNRSVFPAEITQALYAVIHNLKASTHAHAELMYLLKQYDEPTGMVLVSEIPENGLFMLPDGRTFRKTGKKVKRYICLCLNNKRVYLFSPAAEVFAVEEKKS